MLNAHSWKPANPSFCGMTASFSEASVVVYGAPYDGTASFRPGTRFASQAMRPDSWGMESYSPYQDLDLEDVGVFDAGDLELPFGDPRPALKLVEEQTRAIAAAGKLPVMIGGEHSLTLGAVRALIERYPDLHMIHFDAHTDLRSDYLGEVYSHASVIRRCHDLLGDGRIASFGVRSGLREEFAFAREHLLFHPFALDGIEDVAELWSGIEGNELKAAEPDSAPPVYVTLDLDVLDPSVLPGTGTPEPGGVSFQDLLTAVLALRRLNIVGIDVVELSPAYDASGASTAVACKILRELILLAGRGKI